MLDRSKRKKLGLWICLAVLASTACNRDTGSAGAATEAPVTVFAAASLADVMATLAASFEKSDGTPVRCHFAASSLLARQLEAGAPGEVYVSANPQWMDRLDTGGQLAPGTRRVLLANRLVLVVPKGSTARVRFERGFPIADVIEGHVALGDPAHVPAGIYGKEALEALGWWSSLEGRVVPGDSVRAALAFVELGEAGAGVVYTTDALPSNRVTVVGTFPEETHAPIRYHAALIGKGRPAAKRFLDYLGGAEAARVFRAAGFTPLGN